MKKETEISWCDYTFNPWGKALNRTSVNYWKRPLRLNRGAATYPDACERGHRLSIEAQILIGNERCPAQTNPEGEYDPTYPRCGARMIPNVRPRVFCARLSDWLDDEVPIEWLADLLTMIHDTPNLDWLLLTKRPENWYERVSLVEGELAESWIDCIDMPERGAIPQNIFVGTTVEDQKRADERIPLLLKIPARVRFLSIEPMLEAIDLNHNKGSYKGHGLCWDDWTGKFTHIPHCDEAPKGPAIHWVICGGESGPKRRPFDCDWARDLRDQCQAAGVPFFFKQVDKVQPIPEDLMIREFPMVSVDNKLNEDWKGEKLT